MRLRRFVCARCSPHWCRCISCTVVLTPSLYPLVAFRRSPCPVCVRDHPPAARPLPSSVHRRCRVIRRGCVRPPPQPSTERAVGGLPPGCTGKPVNRSQPVGSPLRARRAGTFHHRRSPRSCSADFSGRARATSAHPRQLRSSVHRSARCLVEDGSARSFGSTVRPLPCLLLD